MTISNSPNLSLRSLRALGSGPVEVNAIEVPIAGRELEPPAFHAQRAVTAPLVPGHLRAKRPPQRLVDGLSRPTSGPAGLR